MTGRRIAAAANEGDPLALAAFASFASYLGQGLAMIADVFDPTSSSLPGAWAVRRACTSTMRANNTRRC